MRFELEVHQRTKGDQNRMQGNLHSEIEAHQTALQNNEGLDGDGDINKDSQRIVYSTLFVINPTLRFL